MGKDCALVATTHWRYRTAQTQILSSACRSAAVSEKIPWMPPCSIAITSQVGRAIRCDEHNATLLCILWSTHGTGRVHTTDYFRHFFRYPGYVQNTYTAKSILIPLLYLYFRLVPEVGHFMADLLRPFEEHSSIIDSPLYSDKSLLAESAAPARSAVSNKTQP